MNMKPVEELLSEAKAALNNHRLTVIQKGAALSELKNAIPFGEWGAYMEANGIPARIRKIP